MLVVTNQLCRTLVELRTGGDQVPRSCTNSLVVRVTAE